MEKYNEISTCPQVEVKKMEKQLVFEKEMNRLDKLEIIKKGPMGYILTSAVGHVKNNRIYIMFVRIFII